MTVEDMLYRTRVGCPWRDLSKAFIHPVVDSYGLTVEFEIAGGEVNDCSAASDLIARLPDAEVMVADKGYDSEYLREQITRKGARDVEYQQTLSFLPPRS